MAKKAPPPAPAAKDGKKGRFSTKMLWLGLTFALLVLVSLPTVMLLFFGMLPSLAAYVIDRTEQKYATFCVGGMNICGVFPYLMQLWFNHSLSNSANILTDPFKLAVMYAAAGLGWLLFAMIPPVVATVLTVLAQRRVAGLRNTQRLLIEKWGDEIAQTPNKIEVSKPKVSKRHY